MQSEQREALTYCIVEEVLFLHPRIGVNLFRVANLRKYVYVKEATTRSFPSSRNRRKKHTYDTDK